MGAYQILNWDKNYENDRSRGRDRCSWCAIPNKQGLGRGRLLRMDDGPAMYGCFVSIVLMCSQQDRPREGWLTDTGRPDGIPYDPEAIHIKTGMPVALIARTLSAVSSPTIGWMSLTTDSPPTHRPLTTDSPPTHQERREGKEGKERKDGDPPPAAPQVKTFWETVLLPDQLNYLKRMPRLMEHENDFEAVQRVIRYCQTRKAQWPQIFSFVNKMLEKGHDLLAVGGALVRLFSEVDGGRTPKDIWSYTEALCSKPDVSAGEAERQAAVIKAGFSKAGDVVGRLLQSTKPKTEN